MLTVDKGYASLTADSNSSSSLNTTRWTMRLISQQTPIPCIPKPNDPIPTQDGGVMHAAKCIDYDTSKCSYCSSDTDVVGPRTPLSVVMAYEHAELVHRLVEKEGMSPEEAWMLFEDTKRFLWLCANTKKPIAPTHRIDTCWHNFILFTREYHDFCQQFFGKFIHHRPEPRLSENTVKALSAKETAELASQVFGSVSVNWQTAPTSGCSYADCAPAKDCSNL